MPRCGQTDGCASTIVAGRGTRVTGSGRTGDPIRIDAYPLAIQVQNSSTITLSLTGTGVEGDPLVLSATADGTELEDKWKVWSGTQAEYDALGTYDDTTRYAITGP